MKKTLILFFFWLGSGLLTNSLALDVDKSIQIHGFASQGYLHSTNNNFLAESRSGSYEFTDIGINANWAISDSWRVGGQVFYRNLGDYSEDRPVVDWALLDYRPYNVIGIRLGKVKMPLGLYNETRDNDFLRPMIFLPQSIYDESRRDSNLGYLGGGIYGNLPTGSFGDVDYHFFTGEATFPKESILSQSTNRSLNSSISKNNRLPANKKNPLLPAELNSSERINDGIYGGAIVFNSSAVNLRLGLSLLRSKNYIYVNGASEPLTQSTVNSKFVVSLEYNWQDLTFVSEYGEADRTTKSAGVVTIDGPSQSWYVMVNYAPFDQWTFSVLYDEFYRLKFDKGGDTRSQAPPYTGWRKDFGVAASYDLTENWGLKAEYHCVDGAAMQMSVTNPNGTERYWNYFAAKLSYNF